MIKSIHIHILQVHHGSFSLSWQCWPAHKASIDVLSDDDTHCAFSWVALLARPLPLFGGAWHEGKENRRTGSANKIVKTVLPIYCKLLPFCVLVLCPPCLVDMNTPTGINCCIFQEASPLAKDESLIRVAKLEVQVIACCSCCCALKCLTFQFKKSETKLWRTMKPSLENAMIETVGGNRGLCFRVGISEAKNKHIS